MDETLQRLISDEIEERRRSILNPLIPLALDVAAHPNDPEPVKAVKTRCLLREMLPYVVIRFIDRANSGRD